MPTHSSASLSPARTGIAGLDDILGGGFTRNRLYLIEGDPGSGKTTLALQFLLEGVRANEGVLYVTLSETKDELLEVANAHGFDLSQVAIFELAPDEATATTDAQYTMFHPSEVELSETTKRILTEVNRVGAKRIVFDSLSEMRLLAQSALRYRRQILALKQYFNGRECTVLFLDDRTSEESDLQLRSIAHGVIALEQLSPEYGAERRRLRVLKHRGRSYRGGYHDFVIKRGGLRIFPRLVAAEHSAPIGSQLVSSGLKEVDQLLGGGLHRGTSTLLMGPAGTGKSSMAIQYAVAAANRGEKSSLFIFDESVNTLKTRCSGLGIDIDEYLDKGMIWIQQVDPAELSPGEFVSEVRRAIEEKHVQHVVIDSLNGYLNAMPEERFLTIQLHELLTYVGQQGVNTFLVVAQAGLIGMMTTAVDVSYLADTVLLFRYFEYAGEVRLAISVMKKRTGGHERTIRELKSGRNGITVGEPLTEFVGIMSGIAQPHEANHN